jgi:hypothetical protein
MTQNLGACTACGHPLNNGDKSAKLCKTCLEMWNRRRHWIALDNTINRMYPQEVIRIGGPEQHSHE